MVLGVPPLDPQGNRNLLQRVVSTFQLSTHVPALYREFMCKSVTYVRKSTPSVMSICQSYKPRLTTAKLEHKVRAGLWQCMCKELHARLGVPLVNGHMFTRHYKWLPCLSPEFDPEVFEQNMKNGLVPSSGMVSRTLAKLVCKALNELRFLSSGARATLTAQILNEARAVYDRTTTHCPTKYHVAVPAAHLEI